MRGLLKRREIEGGAPPNGVSAFFCSVFDEHRRVVRSFCSVHPDSPPPDRFRILGGTDHSIEQSLLRESMTLNQSLSSVVSFAEGWRVIIHVLPYEFRRGRFRYVVFQSVSRGIGAGEARARAWAEDQACFFLTNRQGEVCSFSSRMPELFGFSSARMQGMKLSDLFSSNTLKSIKESLGDLMEPMEGVVFHGPNGKRRNVVLRLFKASDQHTVYALHDITPRKSKAESAGIGDRERRRIGQDLHDSIGQLFTAISLLSRSLANRLRLSDNEHCCDAEQISELADEASNQIRQISRGLMPSQIVQDGLAASLRELARITSASCGVQCEACLEEGVVFADGAVESHLYRIAQEAVNNAVRHAGAKHIEIRISTEQGLQQLSVSDDGSWKVPSDDLSGIGLKNMEYRASAIGAHLRVDGCIERGTQVRCRLSRDEGAVELNV